MSLQNDSQAQGGPRWDRYEDLLLDAMQVLPLAAESGARGKVYRALYQPAFHAVTCVTVSDAGPRAAVDVAIASPGVSVRVMKAIGVRFGPGRQGVEPGGDLHWEQAEVSPADLARFREGLAGLAWEALAALPEDRGRDGLLVRGEIAEGGALYRFHAWSPSASLQPESYRYCVAILDAALASAHESHSRSALLRIYPYLRATP